MRLLNLSNGELEILFTQRENFDIVGILDLELDGERLIVGRRCRDLDILDVHLVVDDNSRVR